MRSSLSVSMYNNKYVIIEVTPSKIFLSLNYYLEPKDIHKQTNMFRSNR
jgi:hypothetical protein